jgi:hypothetical protein
MDVLYNFRKESAGDGCDEQEHPRIHSCISTVIGGS